MRPGHGLADLTARLLEGVDRALADEQPDLVLVQGDTTTVFAAALAAFYRGIRVGHVEAGLRSFDLANPFPEEANRRLTGQVASLHFTPTARARDNLLREGVAAERIFLTGNTVVDAVQQVVARVDLPPGPAAWGEPGVCGVYLTLHRRESWGEPLEGICRAILRAIEAAPSLRFVYPVHPQPRVRETVERLLANQPAISLVEPYDYGQNLSAMRASTFIVTDSGGIQEEAPTLGKPVLVLRTVTERMEAVDAGVAALVGTREDDIVRAIVALATEPERRARMTALENPFGDGRAAERIVAAIQQVFGEG